MFGYSRTWWASRSALAFRAFVAGQTLTALAPRGALQCSRLRRCGAPRAFLSFVAYRLRARHLKGVFEGKRRAHLWCPRGPGRHAGHILRFLELHTIEMGLGINVVNLKQRKISSSSSIRIRTRDGGRVAPALLALLACK